MIHAAVRPVTGPGKARVKARDALADRNEVGCQTDDILKVVQNRHDTQVKMTF